ncbi:uncharacterized protein LAESUDRAFT_759199 [Laetiporus sulphureus 93-53]|uniref:Uncharacterized protein n=1 Tax=Laetiporus sulphureus 93-53 TaxID=1314785 RepID=A0A165EC31_9APHY|nr:uncharacterized protein LAESUDRAFT_759199 [Laetiporus sulphureus 93-53]KZT06704.1 hypothetical protein LAESUDRAFT_759199 [Laetiporus sulphureus 93-53]
MARDAPTLMYSYVAFGDDSSRGGLTTGDWSEVERAAGLEAPAEEALNKPADFIYQPHVTQAQFIFYRYQVVIDYYDQLEYQLHRIIQEAFWTFQLVEDSQELYHLLFDEEYGISSSDEEEPF